MTRILEVCVDSTASALAAREGGADRLELCADLAIGGTTPSLALVEQVKAETGLPVRALLRPRAGDFCYDRWEVAQMVALAAQLVRAGADGIVTGVLTPEGQLDLPAMEQICQAARKAAGGRPVALALHRAFDVCRDAGACLEQACALGLATILSSGQAADAYTGRAMLAQMQTQAAGRIEILAGSGVSAANIPELVRQTGVTACHLSGKKAVPSRMSFRREGVKPGMELTGTVRNVIDFGAFVDIGVHQDGLVHISQICNRFIKHPSEVLKVGDVVTVWVLSVDEAKKRIALTMK